MHCSRRFPNKAFPSFPATGRHLLAAAQAQRAQRRDRRQDDAAAGGQPRRGLGPTDRGADVEAGRGLRGPPPLPVRADTQAEPGEEEGGRPGLEENRIL